MNHADHVNLLRGGIRAPGGVWADLGSGGGAFTLALAELLGPDATVHSVDRDRDALARQAEALRAHFPGVVVSYHTADFRRSLDLPPLDGIVMANALHFVRDKLPLLSDLRALLKPSGRLILVEYDTDRGNRWVPFPLSYPTWRALAAQAGFASTVLLATHPSSFLGRFFSALSRP